MRRLIIAQRCQVRVHCECVCVFSAQLPLAVLMPPIGVDTMVLSARTVIVNWLDSSSVSPTDGSVYTVRYRKHALRARYRYVNVTMTTAKLDELRPNTEYEISVKVSRGSRHSTWSMSVLVATTEAGTCPLYILYCVYIVFTLFSRQMKYDDDVCTC